MKKTFILLALLVSATALGASGYPTEADVEFQLNRGTESMRRNQLGTQITRKVTRVLKGVYSFAVQGGSVSTVNLKDIDGKDAVLPDNAVIKQVLFDVITDPTSDGSATIAFGANTTTDLKGATAIGSWTGIVAGVPVGTAATAVKTTAQRTLTATIGTSSLTAGKINAFVEYFLSE